MIYLDWLLKWDEKLGHLLCFKDFFDAVICSQVCYSLITKKRKKELYFSLAYLFCVYYKRWL